MPHQTSLLGNYLTIAAVALVIALTASCSGVLPASEPSPLRDIGVDITNERDALMSSASPVDRGRDPRDANVLRISAFGCGIPDPAVDWWRTHGDFDTPAVVPEIHAALMRFTDDPKNPVDLELAQSYSRSNDGKVFTFILRPALKFSDGSPLTAKHVKQSWERALRKSTGRSAANLHLGNIVGADAVANGESQQLDGVVPIDDRTLEIRLTAPIQALPLNLADPVTAVVKPDNLDRWDHLWSNSTDPYAQTRVATTTEGNDLPIGSGPFALASYNENDEGACCTLVRNDHYWGMKPALDAVTVSNQIIANANSYEEIRESQLDAIVKGDIDLAHLPPFLDTDTSNSATNYRVQTVNTPPFVVYIALNPEFEPLHLPEVRRALATAADRVDLLRGTPFQPANRIFHNHIARGLEPDPPNTDSHGLNSNLLTDLPEAHGLPVQYLRHDLYPVVEGLFHQWGRTTGIHFAISHEESGHPADPADTGSYAAVVVEHEVAAPDPYQSLAIFDDLFSTQSAEWLAFRHELEKTAIEQDVAARRRMLANVERFLIENALVVPVLYDTETAVIAIQPRVLGLTGTSFSSSVFRTVWLDQPITTISPNPQ